MSDLVDATGYAVSCNGKEALEWFNKGFLAFVTLNGNAMTCFEKALELDPEFLLVHCIVVSSYGQSVVVKADNL